jgi:hypothetical protein
MTPSLSCRSISDASDKDKGVTAIAESGCTAGCTSFEKSDQTDPLAAIAAAVNALSPEDRERLAAVLTGQKERG